MKQILGQTLVAATLAAGPNTAHDYTVKIVSSDKVNYHCEPNQITVRSGDTITWVNTQDMAANVAATIAAKRIPKGGEAFISGELKDNGDRWSYRFQQSGTYVYNCSSDPNATPGVVTVDRSSAAFEMENVDKQAR